MNRRQDLASIIDLCLDDIVAGRATVSDCLARYPQHRAELEGVLFAATSMQSIPRPAEQAPNLIRRAMLMELIRETPQQRRSLLGAIGLPSFGSMLSFGLLPRITAAAAPIALAAAVGMLLLVSQPSTPAAASTLTVFAGAAEEQVDGSWRPLTDGASVRQGVRLRTTADGHALLTFPDGSTSSLDPSTEIAIEQLSVGVPRNVQLRQFSGRLWNDVVTDDRPGSRYEVVTQDAIVQVHGTVFETSIVDGQTSVATSEGLVHVVLGADRVAVPTGQIVRAQAQKVAARADLPEAGSLTIDAPFAAALVSERGEATGARADGAIFRQIRGVNTSNPGDGPQKFDFQRLEPGVYTLNLQRFEAGLGDLVLSVNGVERRVPIDDSTGAAQVRVRVETQDGKARVTLAEPAARPAPATPEKAVRVVETERTKKVADVAAQRAVTVAQKPSTTRPVASPTTSTQRPQAGATGATDSTGTQGGSTATRTQPGATGASGTQAGVTGPSTAVAPPALPTGAQLSANEAFAGRLREATARNDASALRAVLREIADNGDTNGTRAQFTILAVLLNHAESAERVRAVLSGDNTLRSRLLDRLRVMPSDQADRLRRALAAEPNRPRPTTTTARTPEPTRTPAPSGTRPPGPPRSAEPTLPTVVDGFSIRLHVALGSKDGEVLRRALAEAVSDESSVTRARLEVLAALSDDREAAGRVDDALDGGASLRARLLAAVDSFAAEETRGRLRQLLSAAPGASVGTPTATATGMTTTSANVSTSTPTSTRTPASTGAPTQTATATPVATAMPRN